MLEPAENVLEHLELGGVFESVTGKVDFAASARQLITELPQPQKLVVSEENDLYAGEIGDRLDCVHLVEQLAATHHFQKVLALYSASKFAVRGFSEGLRRELADNGVRVTYVAPRTTATAMNGATVRELFAASGTAMDHPEDVAAQIVAALEHDRKDVYLGWPERFFVRLNSVLPRLVDSALTRQVRTAKRLLQARSSTKEAQHSS